MKPIPLGRLKYLPRWRCRVGYFHNDTYGFTVHLLVGVDGPKLKAYCEKMFPKGTVEVDDDDDWCGRHTTVRFEDKSKSYEVHVIALQEFSLTPQWIGVLVHESIHAVQTALDSRGLQMDDNTIEAYTYTQDWLVTQCLKLLERKK